MMQNNSNFIEYTEELRKKLSKGFHCGNSSLDFFLCDDISLDKKHGKTYVYLDESQEKIVAYCNITTGAITRKENNVNINCGGSIHVNCFALDNDYHHVNIEGRNNIYLSDILLIKCIDLINNIRDNNVGFSFITLFSTQEGFNMYKRQGFIVLDEDMDMPIQDSEKLCTPMYLPLIDI